MGSLPTTPATTNSTHCTGPRLVVTLAPKTHLPRLPRYPELLKRLDDNSDPIRLASLKAWLAYAECMAAKAYDDVLYQAHVDTVLRGLFIHLDDPEEVVQDAVSRVLKTMAPTVPEISRRHAIESKGRHRNPARCEEIEALCTPK